MKSPKYRSSGILLRADLCVSKNLTAFICNVKNCPINVLFDC